MKFNNNIVDLYKAISRHRMNNNLMFYAQTISTKKKIKQHYSRNYTKLGIKDIYFKNGYGCFNYSETNNEIESISINFNSAIGAYFFHLHPEKLGALEDVITVYSCLQYSIYKIIELFKKSKVDNDTDLNDLQLRFKKSDIVQMIKKLTKFSIPTIVKYLQLFENNGNISFWVKPILKIKSDYLLTLGPLNSSNPCLMIDLWAKELFDHNNQKGEEFEKFIRNEIELLCKKKKFFSKVYNRKNFKSNGEKEEIDLIWETKNTIVIGEIKCIQFPLDSRNIFDYTKVIKKAIKQIKRKTEYLINNKDSFPTIPLNKSIKMCVITNYPLLSGYNDEDVTVIDVGVLTQYISLGYDAYGISNKDEFVTKKQTTFYNDEEEFSNNIVKYFSEISMIERYKKGFELICQKVPLFDEYTATTEEYRWNKEKLIEV